MRSCGRLLHNSYHAHAQHVPYLIRTPPPPDLILEIGSSLKSLSLQVMYTIYHREMPILQVLEVLQQYRCMWGPNNAVIRSPHLHSTAYAPVLTIQSHSMLWMLVWSCLTAASLPVLACSQCGSIRIRDASQVLDFVDPSQRLTINSNFQGQLFVLSGGLTRICLRCCCALRPVPCALYLALPPAASLGHRMCSAIGSWITVLGTLMYSCR